MGTGFFVVALLVVGQVQGQVFDRLYHDLMENYNHNTIPVKSLNTPLNVSIGVSLIKVKSLDTNTGDASLEIWMNYGWKDRRMRWSRNKYSGIDLIRIPSTELWTPDIELYDGEMTRRDALGVVSARGSVNYIPKTTVDTRCDVAGDDTVTCTLKFGSWTYSGHLINVITTGNKVDLANYRSDRWNVISSSLKRNVVYYSCCPEPYPDITATIVFKSAAKKGGWFFS